MLKQTLIVCDYQDISDVIDSAETLQADLSVDSYICVWR